MGEMMKEPTVGQIKEFWEWCGVEPHPVYPTGFDYPEISLNNLFNYLVPKAVEVLNNDYNWDEKGCLNRIFKDWQRIYWKSKGVLSYDLALFWAIYKCFGLGKN